MKFHNARSMAEAVMPVMAVKASSSKAHDELHHKEPVHSAKLTAMGFTVFGAPNVEYVKIDGVPIETKDGDDQIGMRFARTLWKIAQSVCFADSQVTAVNGPNLF